jgi:hypothetical protein
MKQEGKVEVFNALPGTLFAAIITDAHFEHTYRHLSCRVICKIRSEIIVVFNGVDPPDNDHVM